MNETITLVAGLLLTTAGLLALLPLLPRYLRRARPFSIDTDVLPGLAAADSLLRPGVPAWGEADELASHLFDLRMTVSELTADLQAALEVIAAAAPDDDGEPLDATPELDILPIPPEHAA